MTTKPMSISAYPAASLVGISGVALGEAISFADELVLDDVYQLSAGAQAIDLHLVQREDQKHLTRADDSGHIVHLDSCLTLMTPHGLTCEVLILVEVHDDMVEAVYLLPFDPLAVKVQYRLVGIERHTATRRFAQVTCGSFAEGTRITMGDGVLRPVEELAAGDVVLTRDDGKQPLRWVGKTTLRASGSFAPIVITAGTLNNLADLVVRADHRMFVYQRSDNLGAGRPEVLIKARHLVNDDTVYRRPGGYVDYYQLVLDTHAIIYAEGISSESQRVDHATRATFPEQSKLRDHTDTKLLGYEVEARLITPPKAARLLRTASSR